ncbi:MAG: cadherin-like beta sandwich domain-containing protein [Spirochaetaceae bacterium]|nr:cadherin-like beta sandwich domain-containing protein [Spirochaetaceae bacterium]
MSLVVQPAEYLDKVRLEVEKALPDSDVSFSVDAVESMFAAIKVKAGETLVPYTMSAGVPSFKMPEADTTITVIFTSETNYNAFLETLTVSQGTLSPEFAPETTGYSVEGLPASAAGTIQIAFTTAHSEAVTNVPSPVELTLEEGLNSAVITVTSANGEVKLDYTVNVTVDLALNIQSVTVKSVTLSGVEYSKAPASELEFNNMPYITGTNQAVLSVEAAQPVVISEGGGNFNLDNSGAPVTRTLTVTRTVGQLSNSETFNLTFVVHNGTAPEFKIPEANVKRVFYNEQEDKWETVYGITGSKAFTVSQAFTGSVLLAGGGGGGGAGDGNGSWRRGKNGNGGDVTVENGYSFAAASYSAVIGGGGAGGRSESSYKDGKPGANGNATVLKDANGVELLTANGGLGGRGAQTNGGNGGNVQDGPNAGAYPAITGASTEYGLKGVDQQNAPGNIGKGGGSGYGNNTDNVHGRNGGSGVIFIKED